MINYSSNLPVSLDPWLYPGTMFEICWSVTYCNVFSIIDHSF